MDECLRAISGYQGTEDILDDRLRDTPFTSDCMRQKKISSAPSFGIENTEETKGCEPKECKSGSKQWCEAIEKHIPLILWHAFPTVRFFFLFLFSLKFTFVHIIGFHRNMWRFYVGILLNIYCRILSSLN